MDTPLQELPSGSREVASVPIRLPRIRPVTEAAPQIRTHVTLREITLPAEPVVAPMVLPDACKRATPRITVPGVSRPATSTLLFLPVTRLPVAGPVIPARAMPLPRLPEMTL